MRRFLLLLLFVIGASSASAAEDWQVCFSPKGGCTELLVYALNHAEERVLVQAYSFTSPAIAQALIDAQARGVQVQVILDRGQRRAKGSQARAVAQGGVLVSFDRAHAIAHNKVMVIDADTVVTGSFNFTASAEDRNAENLLFIRDVEMAERYRDNWHQHRAHAEP